jgi:rare lipoprotein A
MTTFRTRYGAKYIVALAAAGLMTSTPGHAVIPHDLSAGIETLAPIAKPHFAPVEAIAPVEEAADALEHIGDGEASYYGRELAGNRTASGERFNPGALTAAHRTLPLGTKLKVTNKANGKSVVVRINDRGPFIKKRLIDVSLAAAQQISMVSAGHARVRLELLR